MPQLRQSCLSTAESAAAMPAFGDLTASIAHEIKQPLTAIVTNSEAGIRWLERAEPDLPKALTLMRRIIDNARRTSDIVSRIRSIAVGDAPHRTQISLRGIIEEALEVIEHEIVSNDVTVTLDLEPSLPMVNADRIQLLQVVVNLIINAVQALAAPDLKRNKRIIVRAARADSVGVRCIVEDNGPGIDISCRHRLFRCAVTTKETGMGMGLWISRSIIEAHDGVIHADNASSLGGARIVFTLPAIVSAPYCRKRPTKRASHLAGRAK
jgi:C4-dicarboxylate-specific signal transduction histidine kinase